MSWFKKIDKEKERDLQVIAKRVGEIVKSLYDEESSKVRMTDCDIDKYGTKVIEISGGLNGWGEWDKYFKDLSKVVKKVNEEYRMWLIDMENDCLDDLFYARFGVDFKKDKNE